MINIQNEVQKIHIKYGMSEMANYKIQLLCEQYAKEYHDSEVKKLNIPAVIKSVCPDCNGLTAIMGADGIFRPCHCQSQTVL